MGKTVELSAQNFKETVDRPGTVFIDWWAPWCGPCRAFGPIYDAASEKHTDITFAKINTDEQQELSSVFQITSIPTLMVFRDGILLFSNPGALPASSLEQLIGKVREVDMEDVRKQVAAAQAQQQGSADKPS